MRTPTTPRLRFWGGRPDEDGPYGAYLACLDELPHVDGSEPDLPAAAVTKIEELATRCPGLLLCHACCKRTVCAMPGAVG